jgi:hypothetical protein
MVWSNNWLSLTPWSKPGKKFAFFDREIEYSDNFKTTIYVIGPMAILIGTEV